MDAEAAAASALSSSPAGAAARRAGARERGKAHRVRGDWQERRKGEGEWEREGGSKARLGGQVR